jgi:GNAT superfamily N-acetyltransferase
VPTSDTGITIRLASLADAFGIARVHVSSWRSTYRGIVPEAVLDGLSVEDRSVRWTQNLAQDVDKGWFTLVAEDAGRVVGFASAGPERSEDPVFTGELGALYLLATHQRLGLGRRLVSEAARRLREAGMDSMLIWVLRDNPSRGFYEALGGQYVRRRVLAIGGVDLVEVAYGWKDTAVVR